MLCFAGVLARSMLLAVVACIPAWARLAKLELCLCACDQRTTLVDVLIGIVRFVDRLRENRGETRGPQLYLPVRRPGGLGFHRVDGLWYQVGVGGGKFVGAVFLRGHLD